MAFLWLINGGYEPLANWDDPPRIMACMIANTSILVSGIIEGILPLIINQMILCDLFGMVKT